MNTSVRLGSSGSTNQRFWKSMIFLLLSIQAISVLGGVIDEDRFYFIGLSAIVLIIPGIYQVMSQDAELFSPMNLIFLNLFFGVFLQTIVLCFYSDLNPNLFLDPTYDFAIIATGMAAIAIAVIFLTLGYSFNIRKNYVTRRAGGAPKSAVQTIVEWPRKKVVILAALFGAITLACLIHYVVTIGFFDDLSRFSVKRNNVEGGSGLMFSRFGMRFAQVACIVLFAYHIAHSKMGMKSGVLYITVILFVLASAGPFVSSSRSLLLYFFVALFIVHHVLSGGWRAKQMNVALVMVLAVIIAMGALRFIQQRSVTYAEYSEDIGVGRSVGRIAVTNNFLGIKKTSVLLDIVPSQEAHSYGATYLLWLVAPIPRSLWPEKPTVRIGGVLGAKVYGTRDTNGIPPGFVGEAYYNFGWLGIPFVAFLFGAGIRWFYESFGKRSYSNSRSLLFYSVLLIPVAFASISSDFTGFVSRTAQLMIPLLIAIKIIGIKRRVR